MFNAVRELHHTHACSEVNQVFPELVEQCGYREDNVPQLEDISRFLKCAFYAPYMGTLTNELI